MKASGMMCDLANVPTVPVNRHVPEGFGRVISGKIDRSFKQRKEANGPRALTPIIQAVGMKLSTAPLLRHH